MPWSASAGRTALPKHSACRRLSSRAVSRVLARICPGGSPLAPSTGSPVAIRRIRPATRTMKNSSRLLAKMDRNRTRSSSGMRVVLGEFQHPLVEPEPALLAIQEPPGPGVPPAPRPPRRGPPCVACPGCPLCHAPSCSMLHAFIVPSAPGHPTSRIQPGGPPDPADRRLAQPGRRRHGPGGPVVPARGRRLVSGAREHLADLRIGDLPWGARPGHVPQPGQPRRREPGPPFGDRGAGDPEPERRPGCPAGRPRRPGRSRHARPAAAVLGRPFRQPVPLAGARAPAVCLPGPPCAQPTGQKLFLTHPASSIVNGGSQDSARQRASMSSRLASFTRAPAAQRGGELRLGPFHLEPVGVAHRRHRPARQQVRQRPGCAGSRGPRAARAQVGQQRTGRSRAASDLLVPITPVGPRLSQPATYSRGSGAPSGPEHPALGVRHACGCARRTARRAAARSGSPTLRSTIWHAIVSSSPVPVERARSRRAWSARRSAR